MKTLLVYLKDYRKEAIISPLFKLLEALLELLVPLIMASIIDRGIGERNSSYVLWMGLLLIACGMVGLVVSLIAQYHAAKAAVGFGKKLRQAFFAHIQRFSYSQLDTLGTPMLINRITTDINQVQTGVNMTLRLLLRSPFVVVGAAVMAFTVDSRVAMVFLVMIPLLALVVWLLMSITIPGHREVQGRLDRVLLRVRETLTGVRVIRAFTKEETEVLGFEREHGLLTAKQSQVGRISALMNPLTYVIVNVALIALLWSGGLQVQGGLLTQGAVVALVNYLSQILVELIKFANLLLTLTKSLACASRIEQVLTQKAQEDHAGGTGAGETQGQEPEAEVRAKSVCFDHVSMRYQGAGEEALSDISFQAEAGQTVGIIGGTGSGKSTLVNLIPRFYEATQGRVLVGGVDVRQQPLDILRKDIGVVPQHATLFRGTIRENLLWGNESATQEDLWEALRLAQAAEVVQGKPGGLEEIIEQNGRNVSGGQRQRLTIARALVRKPSILILDDSSSALDFATDAALRKALRGLAGKMTVFITSQRASTVRFSDVILVLEDGALVGSGTHEELLASCRVYQEIYHSQHQGGAA